MFHKTSWKPQVKDQYTSLFFLSFFHQNPFLHCIFGWAGLLEVAVLGAEKRSLRYKFGTHTLGFPKTQGEREKAIVWEREPHWLTDFLSE